MPRSAPLNGRAQRAPALSDWRMRVRARSATLKRRTIGVRPAMLDQPLVSSKMIAEKDGAVGRIIFNNPARHNAVSLDMWQAVAQIMEDYESDDAIRVIVLSGAGGKAFVSGADISEFKEKRASVEAAEA